MEFPQSNKLIDTYRNMVNILSADYEPEEIRAIWFVLNEAFFGWNAAQVLQKEEVPLTESEMLRLHYAIKDLKMHKPVQYITGRARFYDLNFHVRPGVLIPRPETEELVHWILHDCREHPGSVNSLLDIGTGSGCIAVALAANLPEVKVSALDFSEPALEMARENAALNNVKLNFILKDILDEQPSNLPDFDVIVSNPPYVRNSEKIRMQENVLRFEPETALYVSDDDPLQYYRAILLFAQTHLREKGCIYFEINESLGKEMLELCTALGFGHNELRKDMNGKDRMVKCRML